MHIKYYANMHKNGGGFMSYWDLLVREVENSKNEHYFFGLSMLGDAYQTIEHNEKSSKKNNFKQYPLSEPWDNVYLTQREAECVQLCLQGMSMKQVGICLGLSPRTIEFYLKNIKDKMGVKRKKELIIIFKQMLFSEVQVF